MSSRDRQGASLAALEALLEPNTFPPGALAPVAELPAGALATLTAFARLGPGGRHRLGRHIRLSRYRALFGYAYDQVVWHKLDEGRFAAFRTCSLLLERLADIESCEDASALAMSEPALGEAIYAAEGACVGALIAREEPLQAAYLTGPLGVGTRAIKHKSRQH